MRISGGQKVSFFFHFNAHNIVQWLVSCKRLSCEYVVLQMKAFLSPHFNPVMQSSMWSLDNPIVYMPFIRISNFLSDTRCTLENRDFYNSPTVSVFRIELLYCCRKVSRGGEMLQNDTFF
jgi:hypothetical protein